MIVYHGSYVEVSKPDLSHSRKNVDFGQGFIRHLFMNRLKNGAGSSKTEEWLDFILNCRRGMDSSEYDIVMGGVANDKVFNTVELFF